MGARARTCSPSACCCCSAAASVPGCCCVSIAAATPPSPDMLDSRLLLNGERGETVKLKNPADLGGRRLASEIAKRLRQACKDHSTASQWEAAGRLGGCRLPCPQDPHRVIRKVRARLAGGGPLAERRGRGEGRAARVAGQRAAGPAARGMPSRPRRVVPGKSQASGGLPSLLQPTTQTHGCAQEGTACRRPRSKSSLVQAPNCGPLQHGAIQQARALRYAECAWASPQGERREHYGRGLA
jgi:hypothetical protein